MHNNTLKGFTLSYTWGDQKPIEIMVILFTKKKFWVNVASDFQPIFRKVWMI